MEYRTLGRTGIHVSRLCLGTMSFGGDADEAASAAMFGRCRDAGVNFFDCADIYAGGRSEEILGRLIRGCRDDLVITSKVCMPAGPDVNARGLSRRHITRSVETSLRRLGTDRLDLYFVHHFDPHTPRAETLRTLDDLVRQGKILHPAVSNWSAWQIALALGDADHLGLSRFACIQPMYNLVKRQAEVEILPLAEAEELGVIVYSPLGGGLLTGKYSRDDTSPASRLLANSMYTKRYAEQAGHEVADRFVEHAASRDVHPATLAVAWTMAHPAVTAPIIGARNVEQLAPSLAAADLTMSAAWREQIAALSIEPPPATDRAEERLA